MREAFTALLDDEPKLRGLLKAAEDKLADVMELALDKVVAHLDDPKDHPLPADRNTLEWGLYRLVERKSDGDRRRLARKLKDRLDPKARRQRYGDLADIPLTGATPMLDQAKSRIQAGLTPPPAADRSRIAQKLAGLRPPPAPATAAAGEEKVARGRRVAAGRATPRAAAPTRFSLQVERVECVEKTRELFEGADEMALTVSLFTADDLIRADSQLRESFDLGSFDQGQVRGVDIVTGRATIGAAEGLPTAIFAILALTEKDRFGRDSSELDDAVAATLLAFLALGTAVEIFGLVMIILGAALTTTIVIAMIAGFIIGLGFSVALGIRRRLSDDVFEPQKVAVEVLAPDDVFDLQSVELVNDVTPSVGNRKRGRYRVDYRFQLA